MWLCALCVPSPPWGPPSPQCRDLQAWARAVSVLAQDLDPEWALGSSPRLASYPCRLKVSWEQHNPNWWEPEGPAPSTVLTPLERGTCTEESLWSGHKADALKHQPIPSGGGSDIIRSAQDFKA